MQEEMKPKSLFLSFSPKCPPYAELATFIAASEPTSIGKFQIISPSFSLKLGLQRDIYSSDPLLTTSEKTNLSGKNTISRFFARTCNPSLLGKSLPQKLEIDEWLDSSILGTIKKKFSSSKLKSNEISLAEIIVWDHAQHSKDPEILAFSSSLETEFPYLSKVKEIVSNIVSSTHVLDEFRWVIANRVSKILGMDREYVFSCVENKWPKDPQGGDYSIAIPRLKAKHVGSPDVVAKKIVNEFEKCEMVLDLKAIGVFVKFFTSWEWLRDRLVTRVLSLEQDFGTNAIGFGKTAVLDFSSPNIAKPFHGILLLTVVGHLRSTIIGNFIEKTLTANGWSTFSINYLGDWGKQYGLLAVGYNKYGTEEKLLADPIRHLYEVYVKINADAESNPEIHENARKYFAKMEEGDGDSISLWKKFVELSIFKYREIYKRVNVSFDLYSGESKYTATYMRDIVNKLKDLNLLVPSDGAMIVDLAPYKLGGAIIEKRDGGMMYLSRDVAAAIHRKETYNFDAMYYVVGAQQDFHFKQLFKILQLMGYEWAESCHHVNFGMIKSKDGMMSTRKGKVVFLEDILDNVQESMFEVMKRNEAKFAQIQEPEHVADIIGMSAIMIQDMSARRTKDYEFNWDRMLAFEGDTGPYLQYAHTRLCSIERKAIESDATLVALPNTDMSVLTEPAARALLDCIAMYPDIIMEASSSLEPCTIVSYAFRLSHAVSGALEGLYVMNQERNIALARLCMYQSARITLGNALRTLGIVPLDRM